jgi:primosomal protein N' (replication factor Y) (superfamily II helicase)
MLYNSSMLGYAYAEISVNSPVAQRRTFSYGIPAGLDISIGQAVWIPFGDKTLQGIVLELAPYPLVEETREIAGVIDSTPLLSTCQIALARWISAYYLAPLFESVALLLPPGFERRVITYISLHPDAPAFIESVAPEQIEILNLIRQKKTISLGELEKKFGQQLARRTVSRWIQKKMAFRTYELERVKVRPKMVPYLLLKVGVENARNLLKSLGKSASKQAEILQYLIENPGLSAVSEVKSKIGFSSATIKSMLSKGLAEIQYVKLDRDPLSIQNVNLSLPLSLTGAQESVLRTIVNDMDDQAHHAGVPGAILLSGVTGSGKTEIYIQALAEAIKRGKKGIVMVPEIGMTPQILERFLSRFPGRVAIMHSELSLGERFDEWGRIRRGEFDVVIGPRSAIFAPQPDLGLIIIDEEHEWTYKQQDLSPRYHARQVALKLAELTGATLVLGSATPDVESYFKALNREWQLLQLPERVTPSVGSSLPQVEVVDLRIELKAGNFSLFSRSLASSIAKALTKQEQIILFLNRRGDASIVECRNCGWVIRCKRCEVPLSYHSVEELLICHQCNYHLKVPQVCPRCKSPRIKYLGVGTERLEQETARAFPQARILRWDSDMIRGHEYSHQEVFDKFKEGKADILIGTQMVAKGLDFPKVTLVGVICADIALNLPDFRAGERIFQLLSQVAGRAGRGIAGGKVIVQTYSPEHYAIQSAAKHDYAGFYQKEIEYRRELHNPPFSRLAKLTFLHSSEGRCREESAKMKRILLEKRNVRGIAGISIIGPAPAYFHRLRGRFVWQLFLRADNPSEFLSDILFARGWSVDIDPAGL